MMGEILCRYVRELRDDVGDILEVRGNEVKVILVYGPDDIKNFSDTGEVYRTTEVVVEDLVAVVMSQTGIEFQSLISLGI